jgi:hypothetical protein
MSKSTFWNIHLAHLAEMKLKCFGDLSQPRFLLVSLAILACLPAHSRLVQIMTYSQSHSSNKWRARWYRSPRASLDWLGMQVQLRLSGLPIHSNGLASSTSSTNCPQIVLGLPTSFCPSQQPKTEASSLASQKGLITSKATAS